MLFPKKIMRRLFRARRTRKRRRGRNRRRRRRRSRGTRRRRRRKRRRWQLFRKRVSENLRDEHSKSLLQTD